MTERSPCKEFGCSLCCHETEMTLSGADMTEIEKRGHKDFSIIKNGYTYIRNVDGMCIFLKGGLCSIYEYRPLGCRFYPVIFDEQDERAILDDFCPHTNCFDIEPEYRGILARAIALEDQEREERIRSGRWAE